jgi:hypothetical protein
MEWSAARLKLPALAGETKEKSEAKKIQPPTASPFAGLGVGELCKLGLAFTWPLAIVALIALGLMLAVVLRH